MKSIADLRKSYHLGSLEMSELRLDPLDMFRLWWHQAVESEIDDVNAMTLATADLSGKPSARIVLLKGVTNDGFEFFTNYKSAKARDMVANPNVALLFYWKELERQIRIEGKVEKVSPERSAQYFQSRPRGSQIGAWSSPQSAVIPDRSVIEKNIAAIEEKYGDLDPLPAPEHWGGFLVRPNQYEFWQGRADRLHDRFQYTPKGEGSWTVERLAP